MYEDINDKKGVIHIFLYINHLTTRNFLYLIDMMKKLDEYPEIEIKGNVIDDNDLFSKTLKETHIDEIGYSLNISSLPDAVELLRITLLYSNNKAMQYLLTTIVSYAYVRRSMLDVVYYAQSFLTHREENVKWLESMPNKFYNSVYLPYAHELRLIDSELHGIEIDIKLRILERYISERAMCLVGRITSAGLIFGTDPNYYYILNGKTTPYMIGMSFRSIVIQNRDLIMPPRSHEVHLSNYNIPLLIRIKSTDIYFWRKFNEYIDDDTITHYEGYGYIKMTGNNKIMDMSINRVGIIYLTSDDEKNNVHFISFERIFKIKMQQINKDMTTIVKTPKLTQDGIRVYSTESNFYILDYDGKLYRYNIINNRVEEFGNNVVQVVTSNSMLLILHVDRLVISHENQDNLIVNDIDPTTIISMAFGGSAAIVETTKGFFSIEYDASKKLKVTKNLPNGLLTSPPPYPFIKQKEEETMKRRMIEETTREKADKRTRTDAVIYSCRQCQTTSPIMIDQRINAIFCSRDCQAKLYGSVCFDARVSL
jgi:hypothetical protein